MNILVTLNANYIPPLKVMLWSLFFNNPGQTFDIYLMHSLIPDEELAELGRYIQGHGQRLHVVTIDDGTFSDAPVIMHYPKEMYYRLLAYRYLPKSVDKILYLDPDILVINSIQSLYDIDISSVLFAASYHNRIPVKEINRLRLKAYEMEAYYNSGVLLMNLALQREKINENDIYNFMEKNKLRLLLPDQDILNALYGKDILKIDEIKYNYDTRFYRYNKILSNGIVDMDYIMNHTVILHFCGKKKPWHKNYSGKFHSLYKHYEILAVREPIQTIQNRPLHR